MVYPGLLPLMRTPRLPVVDWTDAPADLNGLVCFVERRNLVSAHVPSHFKRSLPFVLYGRKPVCVWLVRMPCVCSTCLWDGLTFASLLLVPGTGPTPVSARLLRLFDASSRCLLALWHFWEHFWLWFPPTHHGLPSVDPKWTTSLAVTVMRPTRSKLLQGPIELRRTHKIVPRLYTRIIGHNKNVFCFYTASRDASLSLKWEKRATWNTRVLYKP